MRWLLLYDYVPDYLELRLATRTWRVLSRTSSKVN